jgi:protoporphyrin/coproporphyrin ferrochelatase
MSNNLSNNRTLGVLVMSYGTPESLDRVEEYYTHIRRGRPPEPEQLAELKGRYEAIVGGVFPLRENTNNQVQALENALRKAHPDWNITCYQGLKHARPFIEDGIQQMAEDGVQEAVGIVLAPHYSTMSVGSYIKRAQKQAQEAGIKMTFVKQYHLHPLLIDALASRVQETLQRFTADVRDDVRIFFSAHSLPEKILELDDPYPQQMLETSRAVIEQAGVPNSWQFVWQSAGATPMPWLGPDIVDELKNVHNEEGKQQVLVCPIGFVSDHLEVLYDIDIECQAVADELGVHLERTPSLNCDERYIDTLKESVLQHAKALTEA